MAIRRALLLTTLLAVTAPASAEPPKLQIDVTMPRDDTGTMRYADRVVIGLPGVIPLILKGIVAIFNDQVALSDTRYLVLGWSNLDSGNRALTILLVERKSSRLVEVARFVFSSATDESALLIRREDEKTRIGVFTPEVMPKAVDDYEPPWDVSYGRTSLHLKDARRMKKEVVPALTPADRLYFPMVRPTLLKTPVIWFDVGSRGFASADQASRRR